MIKIHSSGAYYQGMPFLDLFRISSERDYERSLREAARGLDLKERLQEYLRKAYPRFHFKEPLERHVAAAQKILSVSVGEGAKEAYFLERFPEKRFALTDVADPMLRLIQRHFGGGRAEIAVTSNGRLPFADGAFDLLLALNCEYFYDQPGLEAVLREFARVTAPGGRVLLASYCLREPFRFSWASVKERLTNVSTVLNVFANRLLKGRWHCFTGYRRTVDEFIWVFNRVVAVELESVHFEGGDKQPQVGAKAAIFVLRRP